MELRRKNIIACNRGGKGVRVARPARRKRRLRRLAVIAVNEVEARPVRHATPERIWPDLPYLVPSPVRSLVPAGARLGNVGERDDRTVEHCKAGRIALGAALEEHLLADAQAKEGFAARRLLHRLTQAAFLEASHAVRHGA